MQPYADCAAEPTLQPSQSSTRALNPRGPVPHITINDQPLHMVNSVESADWARTEQSNDTSNATKRKCCCPWLGLPWRHWMALVVTIVVFVFFEVAPLQPGCPRVSRASAGIIIVAFWWVTQCVPPHVTALMPVVVFPLLGVLKASAVCGSYFNRIIFITIGGHLIGIAMKRWDLHKRLALLSLQLMGSKNFQVLGGFMLATWFLSMWMSNTASSLTMLPIASAILRLIDQHNSEQGSRFGKLMLLGVAYSATIGGMASLIGTPPNLVLVQVLDIRFPDAPQLTFGGWFRFGLPLSAILLLIVYLFFTILLRFSVRSADGEVCSGHVIKEEIKALGPMTYEEKVVAVLFVLLALMWITRSDLGFMPGWSVLLPESLRATIDDSTIAMALTLPMFFLPRKTQDPDQPAKAILEWSEIRNDFNFEVLLMLGGGFAIATAFLESGLSLWVGTHLEGLAHVPLTVVTLCLTAVPSLVTEFASNVATSQLMLPIVAELAVQMHINPYMLMLPMCIATQCAFMLPIATAPNMVVFSTGQVPMSMMIAVGTVVDFLAILWVSVFMLAFFPFLSGIPREQQPWAMPISSNYTFVCKLA